jgi:hypothetical protein
MIFELLESEIDVSRENMLQTYTYCKLLKLIESVNFM